MSDLDLTIQRMQSLEAFLEALHDDVDTLNDFTNYVEDHLRFYTLTLKPVSKILKGHKSRLEMAVEQLVGTVDGSVIFSKFEKEGTPNLHYHAMIQCPYITNKKAVCPLGYHTNLQIVRKNSKDTTEDHWYKYIHKELSDSDVFLLQNGNAFEE